MWNVNSVSKQILSNAPTQFEIEFYYNIFIIIFDGVKTSL